MLYSCTHMATVGVKGLNYYTVSQKKRHYTYTCGDLNTAWRLSFSDEMRVRGVLDMKTRYTNRSLYVYVGLSPKHNKRLSYEPCWWGTRPDDYHHRSPRCCPGETCLDPSTAIHQPSPPQPCYITPNQHSLTAVVTPLPPAKMIKSTLK